MIGEKYEALIGKRYGSLVIKGFRLDGNPYFDALCDCGIQKLILARNVVRGNTKSCGCGKSNQIAPGEAAFKKLFGCYKFQAAHRCIAFSLTVEQFRALTQKPCHYCGVEPRQVIGAKRCNGVYTYNGIDRLDSALGYTVENSVPACGWCNKSKSTRTKDEFLAWAQRIAQHSQSL